MQQGAEYGGGAPAAAERPLEPAAFSAGVEQQQKAGGKQPRRHGGMGKGGAQGEKAHQLRARHEPRPHHRPEQRKGKPRIRAESSETFFHHFI